MTSLKGWESKLTLVGDKRLWLGMFWSLSSIYVVLAIYGIYKLFRMRTVIGKTTYWQQFFYFVLALASTVRAICFCIKPLFGSYVFMGQPYVFILFDGPDKLFATLYFTLVIFFVEIHYLSWGDRASVSRCKAVFYWVVTIQYMFAFIMYIINIVKSQQSAAVSSAYRPTAIELVIQTLDVVNYVVCAFLFPWYGRGVTRAITDMQVDGTLDLEKRYLIFRIRVILATISTSFLLKAALTLVIDWVPTARLNDFFGFTFIYYVFLEIVPLFLVLLILQSFGKGETVKVPGNIQTVQSMNLLRSPNGSPGARRGPSAEYTSPKKGMSREFQSHV